MFLHALEHFIGQVEPVEILIGAFQQSDHAKALPVVVEATVVFEQAVKGFLAGVPEG